jgi:phosphate transport system permease protein
MWTNRDITAGGIYPAIVGTFYLGIGVAFFSIPVGIACAIYLNEYAGHSLIIRIIRLAIRNLAGVPSIVYGLFGLIMFVQMLQMGTSIIAASLTLSGMTVPWIITSSEEALKTVPQSFRDGALALGATKWQAVRGNVLPYAVSGMITGSIIGLARAMGETAPIIVVGATFYMRGLPDSPFDKFMALPYHLFILATQHVHPQAQAYAAGTALVLVVLIFIMTFTAMFVRYRFRKRKDW